MNQLQTVADRSLSDLLSFVGFRDPLIDDDTAVLPYIAAALEKTPYAGEPIGSKVPQPGFEHAVRFLGDRHVIKYVSPESLALMRSWVAEITGQKSLLFKYFSKNLVGFDYFFVPVGTHQATYLVVMEKVWGKSLSELEDEVVFGNRVLVSNLLEFFRGNRELYQSHGVSVDLLGAPAARVLDPRYSKNILVTADHRAIVIDTILIPREFDPEKVPGKYRLRGLYHAVYDHLVQPSEDAFVAKLQQSL